MVYDYIAWKEEGVWTASCPGVAGVYGLGDTKALAVSDLRDALEELADYLEEIGERLPRGRRVNVGELRI